MTAPDIMPPLDGWFAAAARDLPWRVEPRHPWSVLVSEVMLQQTPVARVIPVYRSWLGRWPTPADLAADQQGAAVRMWGRLGYPRRALRVHAAAIAVVQRHDGCLPETYAELVALPGVGDYTAAAILAFAHKRRVAVLDTNVRRVLSRVWDARAWPASSAPSRLERDRLTAALPADPASAARLSEAVMELGALVCLARVPRCQSCPLVSQCRWYAAGRPDNQQAATVQPRFAGSDRQVRGLILASLRDSEQPIPEVEIDGLWPDAEQLGRARDSLIADGLIVRRGRQFSLPT